MRHRFAGFSFWLSIVVLASSCGGSGSMPSTPSTGAPADVVITIQGQNGAMSFSPAGANVKVGQTVSWRNADSIDHTATQDAGGFNTGNISRGSTSGPIRMSTAGSFAYHCSVHPAMVGTLTVAQ